MMITLTGLSSLGIFPADQPEAIADEQIKATLFDYFASKACYDLELSPELLDIHRSQLPGATAHLAHSDPGGAPEHNPNRRPELVSAVVEDCLERAAEGDLGLLQRLRQNIILKERLHSAVDYLHQAAAITGLPGLEARRFVLVREKRGHPVFYYKDQTTAVLAHVGLGPDWREIPTIYLSLSIFDLIHRSLENQRASLLEGLVAVLRVEERAVQTGYSHIEVFPPVINRAIADLLDKLITQESVPESSPLPDLVAADREGQVPSAEERERRFRERDRKYFLNLLNARQKYSSLDFDLVKSHRAIKNLGRLARAYRRRRDGDSLREVTRLLVAASGHDLHEIRDEANYLLERLFSPRPFFAPVATRFFNGMAGKEVEIPLRELHLSFEHRLEFFCRVYPCALDKNGFPARAAEQPDSEYFDLELEWDEKEQPWLRHNFSEIGHFDYLIYRRGGPGKRDTWLTNSGSSGRINILPDISGEIILEIFTDIHGHTTYYWERDPDHPGLVYNEDGQIIRMGGFADITAHLEELKERYSLTALYLLGVQKRGSNRQDWDPAATSPSPFSPMSMTEIEPRLGGKRELKRLIQKAHQLDIRVIVDLVPHLNRESGELPDRYTVYCYDGGGQLVPRGSTDGKYGSWNDGRLLNYRCFEVWEYMADSVITLMRDLGVDGVRFDSAHAVPIMMKKNNFPEIHGTPRSEEEMVEGRIIVNDREYGHMLTTGYYDSACRDQIAVPFHSYLMFRVFQYLREHNRDYFLNIAECFWGHERYLSRSGLISYNASLFKVCENIAHGKSDTREIYHLYENYFPNILPPGSHLLGIIGNHDERRALNTFGPRGLQAVLALTVFISAIVMDMEGNLEGENWKVYLDNIYVNWNDFETAANRSVEEHFRKWYRFQRENPAPGFLIWTGNPAMAAALKPSLDGRPGWVGVFNFTEARQNASLHFDHPNLPLREDALIRVSDTLYSPVTRHYDYYTGRELRVCRIETSLPANQRVKLLCLEELEDITPHYNAFLKNSLQRMVGLENPDNIDRFFFYEEFCRHLSEYTVLRDFLRNKVVPLFEPAEMEKRNLAVKRAFYFANRQEKLSADSIKEWLDKFAAEDDLFLREIAGGLKEHFRKGAIVFISAEADPFSKSGGLANVVYELPRELARQGEVVYVITPRYRSGSDKARQKMDEALRLSRARYTGNNVQIFIEGQQYTVGVHWGDLDGVVYLLLDHHEFFDGLYYGLTAEEKIRRRAAFARASAEVIRSQEINPHFIFTNDAYCGPFNAIVRCDPFYARNPVFARATLFHLIHNGGWQYFDSYHRHEGARDLFPIFGLEGWHYGTFSDPHDYNKINCMASGIRQADRNITVSPSYARQILFASDGLERVLHGVEGISNAISRDFSVKIKKRFEEGGWRENLLERFYESLPAHPGGQRRIQAGYPEILDGPEALARIKDARRRDRLERVLNKLLLQFERNLEINPDAVIFSMIHRVCEQKGFQLLLEASYGIFQTLALQAIIGGAVSPGDQRGEEIAHGLYLVSQHYPGSVNVNFGYQDIAVPMFATDFFCMPSMSEPGGISQLEALACGLPVLARATGGLMDTINTLAVTDGQIQGNGFLFSDYSPGGLYDAMERAANFFRDQPPEIIEAARENARQTVRYWDTPARQYLRLMYDTRELIR